MKWFKLMVTVMVCVLVASMVFGQPITLTVISRAVRGGVNTQLVEWFEDIVVPAFTAAMKEKGIDVKVEFIQFSGSDEALKQQYALDLSVGRGADILGFDGFWIPEFAEAGLVKPLEEIVGPSVWDWEGWQYIPQGMREILSYRGKVYGLAAGTDVRVIFYRRDLFQKAGIPEPWQPRSWEELLETARLIKKQLPGVIPLQINAGTEMGEATTMQGWFMVLLGTGIHMFDFESEKWIVEHPGILEALQFYKKVYVDEKLGDARMQLTSGARAKTFEAFREGKIAMLVEGDWFWRSVLAPGSEWAIPNREQIVGWAKMPAKEPGAGYRGQDFVSISGGTGFIINPNTRHPDLAWALLSFAMSKEMQIEFQKIQPRIRARVDVPVIGDPVMSAMAEAVLPLTTVRPMYPEYPKISYQAQLMTERVISGIMTPKEAMEAYKEAVIEIVDRERVIIVPTK
ncbi:ABC transporter substrate-binding protein [Pseudothermotoga thermarum]|uniref:ABC transporter substrate-binding protein n=1 Tax=Pseudothermotoga thermarum TaxID=119394 RepID=UPI0002E6942A|nr:ABC transporter substrate-binding protein [Pseudothermotoga thermarum]